MPSTLSASTLVSIAVLGTAAFALVSPLTAQHAHTDSELGSVEFHAICAPEVQHELEDSVALLHHMMYPEAQAGFQRIAEEDPTCAMAYWGTAMTLFQPLWPARPGQAERSRGWEAIQRAQALEPETDRERALIRAAAAFFEDPEADEWWPRIERWAGALEEAYEEQPDDVEIRTFYALSQLAAGQVSDDQLSYNARAAAVLAEVYEENPHHPGAIHYTIHANDVTGRANESLDVVHSYDQIAPSVPHALHMPSHIFVRLGQWPEVIDWNRRSADAALHFPVDGRTSLHHIHALDYLLYAYLQRGEDDEAARVIEEAEANRPYQEDFTTAFHLAVMPARYAVERRKWEEAARITPGDSDDVMWDRYPWPLALSWFARGLGAAKGNDLDSAREAEARMIELRNEARQAGEDAFATYIEIDRLILTGRIANAEGEAAMAAARIEEAAELESTVEKHPVSPGALLPPKEALGDLLSELDRAEEALAAYEAGLEIWPARHHSLLGAARTARYLGEEERAREHYATLLDVSEDVETDRVGVREARSVLGISPEPH